MGSFKIHRLAVVINVAIMFYACFEVSAEEYKPMIRYDRVWECVSDNPPYTAIKCMKFDGTEEINGKTWHRIVTFIKSSPIIVSDGIYDTEYNVYENEGYMREENGIVYTLIDGFDDKQSDPYDNYGSLYTVGSEKPEYRLLEKVIYNFNCENGETYDGVSFFLQCANFDTFKNLFSSNIVIDGENCKEMHVIASLDFDNPYTLGYRVIEGIGAVDYGCLNYHEFTIHLADMRCHNYLCRVLDMNTNVIYHNGGNYNIKYEGFGDVGTITDGSRMLATDGLISFGEDNRSNMVILYDMSGKQVISSSGKGRICFSTRSLSPGVYLAVASTDGVAAERRKIFVKQ